MSFIYFLCYVLKKYTALKLELNFILFISYTKNYRYVVKCGCRDPTTLTDILFVKNSRNTIFISPVRMYRKSIALPSTSAAALAAPSALANC